MAILKCKMCGGDLTLTDGASVAECEYCGTTQTVPTLDNEKKLNLFARANRLRAACEFDKAAGVYESIVSEFDEEAEAYWGLILCKYGIEYVDDPATGKKIPTCHRSSFECVLDDHNFELVMENADGMARRVYREEAKTIEELRKGIVEVSSKEEPYDIFICYKETAFDGQRTLDSVLAQDIYDALTEKGYRVFFSRVTLEDKLGQEYEPYIFAALQSAKVMLAVGTDYEHYNAVWVKNEWSRFLQLMASGQKKHLIPCFKGIDAYDMPKEFAKLQSQDLGKVGAMQDLLRGIEKILSKQHKPINERVIVQQAPPSAPGADSLLERAFMFLEDGKWDEADSYSEKVLDISPKNAQAYLVKLMAELRVRTKENLQGHAAQIVKNSNYQKLLRFGDQELCDLMHSFEEQLFLEEKARKDKQKCAAYNQAIKFLERGEKKEAYGHLQKLSGYKDADALLETIKKDIHSILARVELNGKWGYINEAGEMVIQPQFKEAFCFASNGLAHVRLNEKWGYINEAGEMVIQPQFENACSFDPNGLARVKLNEKWGYINEAGEMVIQPQFEWAHPFDFNGLARVKLNKKWGYINEAGEMVIPPQFEDADSFDPNGLARVKLNEKLGYINEAGEMVIQPQFEDAYAFAPNGLALITLNEKWGYINEAGEMVIQPQFDWAEDFASNGLAYVVLNDKLGCINKIGEMVIQPQFEDAGDFAPNGFAPVKQNDKWGYINEAGEMVIKPQFEEAENFTPNGLACAELNKKWGYINETGEMVIQPQFELAYPFDFNGLACVKLNEKWGYINEAGEMVIQPQFESDTDFTIIFHSKVKRVKHVQEKAAENRRIAEEKAAEKRRIAEEKAAEERRIAEEKARQKAAQRANWRTAGLCQLCGGELKGFFSKKCTVCGKPKDY